MEKYASSGRDVMVESESSALFNHLFHLGGEHKDIYSFLGVRGFTFGGFTFYNHSICSKVANYVIYCYVLTFYS